MLAIVLEVLILRRKEDERCTILVPVLKALTILDLYEHCKDFRRLRDNYANIFQSPSFFPDSDFV